ncbi:UNVERIFIED_CONTAM: hypothetical protein O8I53_10610 [Campylobacter lari]
MKLAFKSVVQMKGMAESIPTEYITETLKEIYTSPEGIVYTAYTFKEPESRITNRFEINENSLNIFRGKTSLFFELNKKNFSSEVPLDNGTYINLQTELLTLEHNENIINAHYKIFSLDGMELSNCILTLVLENN